MCCKLRWSSKINTNTKRKFKVRVSISISKVKKLDRGCVQGSDLGPTVFSINCGSLREALGDDSWITSYANDVIVSAKNQEDLTLKIIRTMGKHFKFMNELCMVINVDKTL